MNTSLLLALAFLSRDGRWDRRWERDRMIHDLLLIPGMTPPLAGAAADLVELLVERREGSPGILPAVLMASLGSTQTYAATSVSTTPPTSTPTTPGIDPTLLILTMMLSGRGHWNG